jgi:cytochrome c oxidase assembly factor CtaG
MINVITKHSLFAIIYSPVCYNKQKISHLYTYLSSISIFIDIFLWRHICHDKYLIDPFDERPQQQLTTNIPH